VVVAGATGGAGTLACAFLCVTGVASADLPALPDALIGALTPGSLPLPNALFGAVASRLPALFGVLGAGLSPIGLSEVVPLMLKFYKGRSAVCAAAARTRAALINCTKVQP